MSVFEKCSPSVVFITSKSIQRDFFSMDIFEIPQGAGSGFIWDAKGHIVTNFHVIQNADNISVKLSNGKTYDGKIIGVAPNKDLAVLKIAASNQELQPVEPGSVTDLKVGRKVLAIGNPFGLDQTLTIGIISALGRQIQSVTGRTIHNVIQTDAAINPGNSGGPLLNSKAQLIGVNTAIMSPSGTSAGIGFAVPVDIVKSVVPQLIRFGKEVRPGLGVQLLSDDISRRNNINGVIIASVMQASSAQKAGLRGIKRTFYGEFVLGDVIVGINDVKVASNDELSEELEKYKVGQTITVQLLREGKKISVSVVLQEIS
ncbi:MAG: trypsin-like peptidase domain-containing protein [Chitinivibrionales bacterium]|nr:trypsin-like peptidase domain-containing protein [Chitinivibrionales bacterium]